MAAALRSELEALSPAARAVLEAAAVVGEPFEPDVVAAVAELDTSTTLAALDSLSAYTLVRQDDLARRFSFRHPIVREAVYDAVPGDRRVAAHARAAAALERRGAGLVVRAHHVEQSARHGASAIALLTAAAWSVLGHAPAAAAHYFAQAQRLLPDHPPDSPERIQLLGAQGDALAAAGEFDAARVRLREALTLMPDEPSAWRAWLIAVCARMEVVTGRWGAARRRLDAALRDPSGPPSGEHATLSIVFGVVSLAQLDFEPIPSLAARARQEAVAAGDRHTEARAWALRACGDAMSGRPADAQAAAEQAARLIDAAEDEALALHLRGLQLLAAAESRLGRLPAAIRHLRRGEAISRQTGHGYLLVPMLAERVAPLVQLGQVTDAVAAGEEAVAVARLSGSVYLIVSAQAAAARARLLSGDAARALREAEECAELASSLDTDAFPGSEPGWTLGLALAGTSDPERGLRTMLDAAGGESLPRIAPFDRAAAWVELAECRLQLGDVGAAAAAVTSAEECAATTGRALAATGERAHAIRVLKQAAMELEATDCPICARRSCGTSVGSACGPGSRPIRPIATPRGSRR